MTYVDMPFRFFSRNPGAFFVGESNAHLWCHLAADSLKELHAMAASIGLKRSWFQDKPGFPHYDLTPGKRLAAICRGSVIMTRKEFSAKFGKRGKNRKVAAKSA